MQMLAYIIYLMKRLKNGKKSGPTLSAGQRAEMAAIYAEVDRRVAGVERGCRGSTVCCQFVRTGRTPVLTLGEALVAAKGVRASGRKKLPEPGDGRCPLLNDQGRCTIYEFRPLGCRTHFCAAAGGMIPRGLVKDLIQRLEVLDEQLGGDGSRELPAALAAVL